MAKSIAHIKHILVYADWFELGVPHKVGILRAEQLRGKKFFHFLITKNGLNPDSPPY